MPKMVRGPSPPTLLPPDLSASDSSDADEAVALPLAKLQNAPLTASTRRRLQAAATSRETAHGVVYLGRIPRGFFEDQMRAYFSQFGEISRLRLSRNRKTGASKHYAFIEFESRAVAEIVADTMHNYLLLGHMLQCHLLDDAQIHPNMWIGANRKFRPYPAVRVAREQCNAAKDEKARAVITRRLVRKQSAKQQAVVDSGIDYELPPGYAIGHSKPL